MKKQAVKKTAVCEKEDELFVAMMEACGCNTPEAARWKEHIESCPKCKRIEAKKMKER